MKPNLRKELSELKEVSNDQTISIKDLLEKAKTYVDRIETLEIKLAALTQTLKDKGIT